MKNFLIGHTQDTEMIATEAQRHRDSTSEIVRFFALLCTSETLRHFLRKSCLTLIVSGCVLLISSVSTAREAEKPPAHRRNFVACPIVRDTKTLPLNGKIKKLYLYKINPQIARDYGFTVVEKPEDADLALLRTATPFETLHPNYFFGARQHEGDLSFHDGNADYEAIKAASAKVPTVVTIYLDRPGILTNVKDKVAALVGNFGVSDMALFDVLTGKAVPGGRLPFELPSSMEEVKAQAADAPYDTKSPLYKFGYGLAYPRATIGRR